MNIIKQTSTNATNYCPNRSIKWIVIHYTAGVYSSRGAARNTASWFANPAAGGSADFVVDDAEVVQFSPDIKNYLCWHAGVDYSNGTAPYWGKCTNANSIGIEICSCNKTGGMTNANDSNYYFTDAAIANAVELVKYLMKTYNIPASNVIRHWDVCRKPCPGIRGWNTMGGNNENKWLEFKKKIGAGTATANTKNTTTHPVTIPNNNTLHRVQCGAFSVKANADKFVKTLKAKGFNDAFIVSAKTNLGDVMYRVQCGAFKNKANAEALKKKLQAAGVKDAFVMTSGAATKATKTVDEVAREVIAGKWGVGDDRRKRLEAAGYNYAAVQARVNTILK